MEGAVSSPVPMTRILALALALAACAAPPAPVERPVISLFGDTLVAPPMDPETRARLEADHSAALAAHEASPEDLDATVWLGRRAGYLWRYREAIDVFTRGLAIHPGEPHLLRHRGHRLLTVRDFEGARTDLLAALETVMGQPDEIEPDGQPNAAGIPTSTLQTNILYHLGLAEYLLGDFAGAASRFTRCREIATNDDMRVAAADWEYMALRRAGRHEEAQAAIGFVTPDMELLENHVYHRRILMYRGLLAPDSLLGNADALDLATQGYGVGNWYLAEGDTARALDLFRGVLAGDYWAAFGYLAAEADVARLAEGPR